MLAQITGIPLPANDNSTSTSNTVALNRALPVGQNVSATVIAVSRDQVQPEIFRLKLEINNRLIQMGVFQALQVGQKINVSRGENGQIQIQLPTTGQAPGNTGNAAMAARAEAPLPNTNQQQVPTPQPTANNQQPQLRPAPGQAISILPEQTPIQATVISSRPLITATAASPGLATQTSAAAAANPAAITDRNPATTQQAAPSAPTQNSGQSAAPTNRPATTPAQTGSSNPASGPAPGNTAPAQPQANTNVNSAPVSPQVPAATTNRNTIQNATAITTNPAAAATRPTSAVTTRETVPQQPVRGTATVPNRETPPPPASNPATNSATSPNNNPAPREYVVTMLLPNGRQIQVIANQALPQGSELQLTRTQETVQASSFKPSTEQPTSALDRTAVKQALRDVLPSQMPVADAFNQLAQLSNRSDTAQAAQITSVVRSLLQLFGIRPGTAEAAGQIRQNIELGGMTAEQRLSRGILPSPMDMRQQLQQLSRLSEQLPADQKERLEQLVRGLHSRVTSQQLNSLQQWREMPDGSFERVMQLDLPVRQGERWENLELRLSREARHNTAGELISQWRVRLHFDLEQLGALDAEIRLTDQHQISALFWCEKPETTQLLQQKADDFAERLQQCGFSDTEIQSQRGQAPKQHAPVHKELIDLHT
ncbi:flagellar hook-length control protein FliK [Pontibacter sp. JAM-7]|uniref:flagellar hook-length control protein FliK n=1 Tax=Pontibacter sp. JAM-7 TaxID=3366581 RepID=UPI003AF5C46F